MYPLAFPNTILRLARRKGAFVSQGLGLFKGGLGRGPQAELSQLDGDTGGWVFTTPRPKPVEILVLAQLQK
ncbi:hypothetical protein DSO57_1020498 [Entomophthora muscae]|uniref:Uncharacterized protein n=1 Tax=Entomophthora muscae TaxID=34485 RepID=A0ACC2UPE7_9FUNG|nr:hypothetical protein DSO57_1020498 [Entomophthora muscae]